MKRFSICLAAAAVLASGLAVGTASGEFLKIDDFEKYSIGELDGQGDGNSAWVSDAGVEVAVEPGTSNQVLNALAGAFDATAVYASGQLEIADGTTGTLFVRFRRGAANHAIFGMSDLEDPLVWGDFETAIGNRYETGRSPGVVDVRNGGAYQNVADVAEDEWVNVWMVIDNDNDETQVYAQSEITFSEQTLLEYQTESNFLFRNGTGDPLVSFFLRIGADYHEDDFYLDDIYMDQSGENLSDPRGGAVYLLAGDADMDLDFDQLDLVRVQVAAKYLTGQTATWGEGDWNGAPGENPAVLRWAMACLTSWTSLPPWRPGITWRARMRPPPAPAWARRTWPMCRFPSHPAGCCSGLAAWRCGWV